VINPTTKLMFFRENIPSTETLIYIYIYFLKKYSKYTFYNVVNKSGYIYII
jgi:hypothetical protein